tara:strand:- start:1377 stop:1598 length:222 start_codon:yes stop_codon:yes gene_type:complete
VTLRDYIERPKKEWTDKEWLQEAHIMVHSPWISEEDRDYWRDKIKELSRKDSNLRMSGPKPDALPLGDGSSTH